MLTIARRQPMAVDRRKVVGALRLANHLERIGDLAKNIAKRVVAFNGEFPPPKLIRGVEHMTDLVLEQMKLVLDAYGQRDVSKAMMVWRGDEEIDAVCTSVFRELLTYMMEDPRNITFCIHLMFARRTSNAWATTRPILLSRCTNYRASDCRPAAERRYHDDRCGAHGW